MKYLHPDDAEHILILKCKKDRALTKAEELIIQVVDFNHRYEYLDDIEIYRKWSAAEISLRKELQETDLINTDVKALALKAIKDISEDPNGPLEQLRSRYPNIKYRSYQTTGFIKLLEEKGDTYMEKVIETLRELDTLFQELPENEYPGWFISTPSTPHQKIMRDHAHASPQLVAFYGCTLSESLQGKITAFFETCMLQRDDWKVIANDARVARSKSAGVNFDVDYVSDANAPVKYTGTQPAWITLESSKRCYHFYV